MTTSPTTSDLEGRPFNPPARTGGFRFATAVTDTTFTLTANRGGRSTSQSVTAQIVPNPFDITLELTYDCANRYWSHPGFGDDVYTEVLTVDNVTNLSSQAILLEHSGVVTIIGGGESAPIIPPTRFAGRTMNWIARLASGAQPMCPGDPPLQGQPPPIAPPPPIQITVRSTCPAPSG